MVERDATVPAIEGFMYIRLEKKSWMKRYCKLYRQKVECYAGDPKKTRKGPSEEILLTPDHFVQAASTKKALKKRKHAFLLSDFETNIYFSGMQTGSKRGIKRDREEIKITRHWMRVFGEEIASIQVSKKWWIKKDFDIIESEEDLTEDYDSVIQNYKEFRGADSGAKTTEQESEAAIARMFVGVAANRASVRFISKQEKEAELLQVRQQLETFKQEREAEQAKIHAEEVIHPSMHAHSLTSLDHTCCRESKTSSSQPD